jgi:hypothetical protein
MHLYVAQVSVCQKNVPISYSGIEARYVSYQADL